MTLTEEHRKRFQEIQTCAYLNNSTMYAYFSDSTTAVKFLSGVASCRRINDVPLGSVYWSITPKNIFGPYKRES